MTVRRVALAVDTIPDPGTGQPVLLAVALVDIDATAQVYTATNRYALPVAAALPTGHLPAVDRLPVRAGGPAAIPSAQPLMDPFRTFPYRFDDTAPGMANPSDIGHDTFRWLATPTAGDQQRVQVWPAGPDDYRTLTTLWPLPADQWPDHGLPAWPHSIAQAAEDLRVQPGELPAQPGRAPDPLARARHIAVTVRWLDTVRDRRRIRTIATTLPPLPTPYQPAAAARRMAADPGS